MNLNFPGGRGGAPTDDDYNAVHAAMSGVFNDLRASRVGVQRDLRGGMSPQEAMMSPGMVPAAPRMTPAAAMLPTATMFPGATSPGSPADAMGLAYAFRDPAAGAGPAETPIQQARRIMSGQAAGGSGNIAVDDAMGVSGLRSGLDARRSFRMKVAPYLPTDGTPPEVAANNLHYLDRLTLQAGGLAPGSDTAATGGQNETGQVPIVGARDAMGRQPVDQNRAAVQAMSDYGSTPRTNPAEKNRLAIIEAMKPVTVPDPSNPGKTITRPMTVEEAMGAYANAGGTGLSMGSASRVMESEERAKTAAATASAKKPRPTPVDEFKDMLSAYKEAMGGKDYVAAQFLAQKMGHKFPNPSDKMGTPIRFNPEWLPGYTADEKPPVAAISNSAPNAPAVTGGFKTAEDVRAAFQSGTIDRAAAESILKKQFGHR